MYIKKKIPVILIEKNSIVPKMELTETQFERMACQYQTFRFTWLTRMYVTKLFHFLQKFFLGRVSGCIDIPRINNWWAI